MSVYLVAGFEALIYLCAIPVCVVFRLNTRGDVPFGAGVGLFRARVAARGPKKSGGRGGRALRLLARLRHASVSLRGRVDLGDAAATALACGALRALAPALGIRAERVTVDIAPVFDGDGPRVELTGMMRARAGQIIIAAARGGINSINGRIAQWKDTRSRAS